MAGEKKAIRKIYFTIGGRGLAPDVDFRKVGGGAFTKRTRGLKSKIIK